MFFNKAAAAHYQRRLGILLCLLALFMPAVQAGPLNSASLNGVWELVKVDELSPYEPVPEAGFPVYWVVFAGNQFSMIQPGSQKEVAFGTLDIETGSILVQGLSVNFPWMFRMDERGLLVADEVGGAYSTFKKISEDPAFRAEPVLHYAPVTMRPIEPDVIKGPASDASMEPGSMDAPATGIQVD